MTKTTKEKLQLAQVERDAARRAADDLAEKNDQLHRRVSSLLHQNGQLEARNQSLTAELLGARSVLCTLQPTRANLAKTVGALARALQAAGKARR